MPAARRGDCLTARSPGVRFVGDHRYWTLKDRVDNSPRLLDIVLSRKERRITGHRIRQHSFVSFHLPSFRVSSGDQLYGTPLRLLTWRSHRNGHCNSHLRTDAKTYVVLGASCFIEFGSGCPPQTRDHLRAGGWQILSGSNIEGNTFPARGADSHLESSERLR